MARLTELGEADLFTLCERFSLGALQSWQPIEAGTINSNYRLETSLGRFFLRVNEDKQEDEVAYEALLVQALASRGVATPQPVEAKGRPYDGYRGKWISVFPWVDGHHVEESQVTSAHAYTMGAALAGLHRAADEVHELPPRHGRYTEAAMSERLAGLRELSDAVLTDTVRLLSEEEAWLRAHPALDADGIIHGDLFCDNVLWHADSVAALLDFEQASLGRRSYDLAVCINAWCGTSRELGDAMIGGYHSTAGETVDEAVLARDLRCAAWRFTITRITDVYLRGIRGPGKDFRDYRRRLEHWRSLENS